jgi:membrane-bound lytic murein transglycosylase D
MSKGLLVLVLPILASCQAAAPVQPLKVVPPPLSTLQQQAEPVTAPIPAQLSQINFDNPIDLAIFQARFRFENGEGLYEQSSFKLAKEQFDSAVDLILDTAAEYPNEQRLQRELQELVARVTALELNALREGEGLTETDQPAAIDDLQYVETFPALIDPGLKSAVEEEVQEIVHDLPIEINERVLGFLNYYHTGRGRNSMRAGLERVGRYQPMIERIMKEEGVPLDLIYLCQAESAFEPRAVSRAAAKGMWQFISSRGREYGLRQTWWIDERFDPEKATRAAARHLKDLYQEFGDWYLAMAAYNSGPLRVHRALEKTGADNFWRLADKRALPKETINYIPNIIALTIIGKNPAKYGFEVTPVPALEVERVNVDKATDLRIIAEAIDLPIEDLRTLNTHVLRWITPPDDPDFQLILPKGFADRFNEEIAALPENERVRFRQHVVKKGETLASISKKYGTTVAQMSAANNLGKKPAVKAGQSLIIPVGISVDRTAAKQPAATAKASATESAVVKETLTSAYTVRRGDTLSKIASRFRTTVEKLKLWNNLSSTRLAVGRKLVIAPSSVQTVAATNSKKLIHQVKKGETLDRIATTYGTSVGAIISWNESEDLSVIRPGDRLTIFPGDNN